MEEGGLGGEAKRQEEGGGAKQEKHLKERRRQGGKDEIGDRLQLHIGSLLISVAFRESVAE